MNDVGAYLPPDALRAIARNLEAPASFASHSGTIVSGMRRPFASPAHHSSIIQSL